MRRVLLVAGMVIKVCVFALGLLEREVCRPGLGKGLLPCCNEEEDDEEDFFLLLGEGDIVSALKSDGICISVCTSVCLYTDMSHFAHVIKR